MPLYLFDLLQKLSMLPIKPCCLPLLLIQSYSLILTLSLLCDPFLAISLNLLLTLFNSFLTNKFHVIFFWLLVEVLSLLQVGQFTLFRLWGGTQHLIGIVVGEAMHLFNLRLILVIISNYIIIISILTFILDQVLL